MSEELIQRGYTENGLAFGRYEYFNLGSTTIRTLRTFKIIPNRAYTNVLNKRPDGLLVDRNDPNNINVIAVFEYKAPSEFDTPDKKIIALDQCVFDYCKPMGAKIGIVTDGTDYIWVNPQLPNDEYETILREDGYPLHMPFDWSNSEEIEHVVDIIDQILTDISPVNSQLISEIIQNPSNLADRVWQTIWLASGENPDACLATFVEIFVYKYLSDLGILLSNNSGIRISFYDTLGKDRNICLIFYFENVRNFIKQLFPPNPNDNTSVINGIVLNPRIEEHNLLFYKILEEFNNFGPLTNIDPEFKSRLYEHFLKKSISQKNWGQFFTPRNIIKAIIEISEIEKLGEGSKVHDPACGVGGFILEPFLTKRARDYYLVRDRLNCKLEYTGHDRDQKTIILAKANMLIHLNEIIRDHPNLTREFSNLFNFTFESVHSSVLGSLGRIPTNEYDLVMTNPPFVMTGTSKYKEFIQENGNLRNFYTINALGVEGLFLEKIIKSLKPNGKAFIIIPDGITNRLADHKIRNYIRNTCIIEGIISLPKNTFYTTPKKTYILAVTKKLDDSIPQTDPVFSYLVVNTGETLDANRFTCENDLPEMVKLFKYFKADKSSFVSDSKKCKIWQIDNFDPNTFWSIDRWWTEEEKVELGLIEEKSLTTLDEFTFLLESEKQNLEWSINYLNDLGNELLQPKNIVEIELSDERYFELFIGKRILKKDLYYGEKGTIPVFSANVNEPMGWMNDSNITDFENDFVLWGIDGNFDFNVIRKGTEFRSTDHCGAIRIKDAKIDPYYLYYFLISLRSEQELDRELRASMSNMKKLRIAFPVLIDSNGNPRIKKIDENLEDSPSNTIFDLDLEIQKKMAEVYISFDKVKSDILTRFGKLRNLEIMPLR